MIKKYILIHPIIILNTLKESYFPGTNLLKKKKVGCVLGTKNKKINVCRSSFEIPFQEKSSTVFFINLDYLETMSLLHKKINSIEEIVGSYAIENHFSKINKKIMEKFFLYSDNPIHLNIWADLEKKRVIVEAFLFPKNFFKTKQRLLTLRTKIGLSMSEVTTVSNILKNSLKWKRFYKNNWFNNWLQNLRSFSNLMENFPFGNNNDKGLKEFLIEIFQRKNIEFAKVFKLKKKISNEFLVLYLSCLFNTLNSCEKSIYIFNKIKQNVMTRRIIKNVSR
jgi:hypothetical protein